MAELERQLKRVDDAEGGFDGAMAERLALFQEAERIAHVGTWMWNVVTDEVRWSDELYRILGYEVERDAPSTDAFFARIHPEDRERVAAATSAAIASGIAERIDHRVLRPDGSVRCVSMDAALLFDHAGALVRAVGTIHDLTEERAAVAALRAREQTLDEIARAVGVGWFRYDVRGGQLTGSLHRVLGVSEGALLELGQLADRILAADRERAEARWTEVLAGAEAVPFQLCMLSEAQRLVHVYVVPIVERDERGPTFVRGVAVDVTQRAELEARLRQSEKMDVLGQVAAGVAHDFNNLLTVILCNVERLALTRHDEAVDYIASAAQSAAQLTRRLLAFSRQAVVEPRDVDVTEAIAECLAIVGRAFEDHIRIVHPASSERVEVRVDPSLLQQILLNLTLNARDAMRERGGTLTVSSRRVSVDLERARAHDARPGSYVEIAVTDTGIGMSEALVARIFEPFFTTKDPGQGTGLGLATVFGAVRQSDGFIEVTSALGQGSEFRVLLPCTAQRALAVERGAPRVRTSPRRILLVEDEPMVATSLARMLRRHGHEVTACTTPSSGIAAWRAAGGFELLITDYLMPEMTGLQLTERLRIEDPELPVLILSGWGYESEPVAAMRRAQALPKPFTGDELLHAISRAVGS